MAGFQHPVEAYFDTLPDGQARVVERLHHLMLVHPGVSARLRYGIPFYDLHSWFAYTNPLKSGRVECCFLQGRRILEQGDPSGLLEHRERKMVAGILLGDLSDLERKQAALLAVVDAALAMQSP